MKKFILFTLVMCISFYTAAPVFASEQDNINPDTDWENCDWSTIDWNQMDWETEESLSAWIEKEADCNDLFQLFVHTDGGMAASVMYAISVRFFDDPTGFILALSTEEADIQETILHHFPQSTRVGIVAQGFAEFVAAVNTIELDEAKSDAARAILAALQAAANPDWSKTNWEIFNWQNLSDHEIESLTEWLKNEADLATMFLVTTATGDGWVGELLCTILSYRFQKEPYTFVQEAAKLDEPTINAIALDIGTLGFHNRKEAETFFGSLILPQKLTPAEQKVMDLIVAKTEGRWKIELPSPKTGDPFGFVALGLSFSGLCGGWMMLRRKRTV